MTETSDAAASRMSATKPVAGIILALWLAEISGSFETAMILAAFKSLLAAFKDPVLVGWLVTAYLVVGAAAAAVAGRLGDIYGRRRIILILLAVGVLGSLISAASSSFAMLLTGRVLQGLTGAILPLCVGLVRENLSRKRVAMGIGLMISGASIGTAFGLVGGGFIVDHFAWHGIFIASAGFCALAFVAILLAVPVSKRIVSGPVDWLSGVLFAPGILALLLYISNGPKWGWASPVSLATLALALVLLAWWLRHTLASADPLIDIRLFRNRNVAIANLVTALVSASTLQITLVFSLMLQAPRWTLIGLGVSATVAGLVKLPSNLLSMFAGPLSGWLTERGGGRVAMVAGGALTVAGWTLALIWHDTITQVITALCVISFGTTMLFAVGPTIVAYAVPHSRTSEVAGMMTVVRQAFLGIGAQMVTILLATQTVQAPGDSAKFPTPGAFALAIGVIIALCAVATLVALALPRKMEAESA